MIRECLASLCLRLYLLVRVLTNAMCIVVAFICHHGRRLIVVEWHCWRQKRRIKIQIVLEGRSFITLLKIGWSHFFGASVSECALVAYLNTRLLMTLLAS